MHPHAADERCFSQVKTLPPYPDAEVRVPAGHAWVEGARPLVMFTPQLPRFTFPRVFYFPRAHRPQGDEPFRTEDSNRFGAVSRVPKPNARRARG